MWINREEEIAKIRMQSLRERAQQPEKEASCLLLFVVFASLTILGFYYCFVDDVILNYKTVSPFWGFVIFVSIAVVLLVCINYINNIFWKEYNDEIKNANRLIRDMIQEDNYDGEDFLILKKEYIERKIIRNEVSKREYEWHSSRYCWGCGQPHKTTPVRHRIYKQKTETWKEGALRKSQTFSLTTYIPICPDCSYRLNNRDKYIITNERSIIKIDIFLVLIIAVVAFIYNWIVWSMEEGVGNFILFGLGAATIGQIIVFPLASFISNVILNSKNPALKIKYNFNHTPQVRDFENTDQHVTKDL